MTNDTTRIPVRTELLAHEWAYLEMIAKQIGSTIPALVAELVHRALPENTAERVAAHNAVHLPRQRVVTHGTASGYRAGCSKNEDCPNNGVSTTCVQAFVEYQKVWRASRRTISPNVDRKQVTREHRLAHLRTLRDAGKTPAQIVNEMGLSLTWVYQAIRELRTEDNIHAETEDAA
jgi:hypothetical protein